MGKWHSAFINSALVVASVAITLLTIEAALRLLPIAWAPPVQPPTPENPIQRYAQNHPFTWSLGWNLANVVRGRSNAQGFLADYDYDASASTPLVAVVGDSFVEALRVPFADSITGRLQAVLGNRGRAYAFAQSGSPLSQYVAYARHACAVYRPSRMIVNVVGNDFDESLFAHRRRNGIHHLYPNAEGGFDLKLTPLPAQSLVERMARRSALALYLMRNVGISDILVQAGINMAQAEAVQHKHVGQTDANADARRTNEGYQIIDWFLEALPKAACLPAHHIAIVVDTARPQMYDAGGLAAVQSSYFGLMRSRLLMLAMNRRFVVIDTEPHFLASYAKDRQQFEWPNDGHWNSRGHAVATMAAINALRDWPPLGVND